MATAEKAPGAFRTIGELSQELGVAQHILRYWETKFPQLKPLQRAGNRRYYRPADVELARKIHRLLSQDGYTVRGVQKLLRDRMEANGSAERPAMAPAPAPAQASARQHAGPFARLCSARWRDLRAFASACFLSAFRRAGSPRAAQPGVQVEDRAFRQAFPVRAPAALRFVLGLAAIRSG